MKKCFKKQKEKNRLDPNALKVRTNIKPILKSYAQ